ncbi:amino acid adenylation domain-containing protein [Xenorhabdus bovienii]|uniref:non-ribosomal peptide synthetase n=1 Tax=Xenorhabdus bovienii TaxID=40576 RepID=UPI0023B262D9|nr:non-ribosomal peptide synthetase [Xenorhabdus bovienii]MDE9436114.1 amino acid adenylation domain-containing protein [Xenorhabdus bovienii]MDE9497923.1 amino acid adenylation domain-containing protein [Xenorhabdus bovienii]
MHSEQQGTQSRLPLNEGQVGLWLALNKDPENIQYLIPLVVEITGEISASEAEQAWQKIQAQHPLLKAQVEEQADTFFWQWSDTATATAIWDIADLQGKSPAEQHAWISDWLFTPFNAQAKMFSRAVFLKTGLQTCKIAFVFHHMIFDGTSTLLLLKALKDALHHVRVKQTSPVSPAIEGLRLFVEQQRDYLSGSQAEQDVQYWRTLSAKLSEKGSLTPRKRILGSEQPDYQGYVSRILMPEQWRPLKEVCQQWRVTPGSMLLATFRLLLSRYFMQKCVTIAVPASLRDCPQYQQDIGYFVNLMMLALPVDESVSFKTLLQSQQRQMLASLRSRRLPLTYLARQDGMRQFASAFNAGFNYHSWFNPMLSDDATIVDIHWDERYRQPAFCDFVLEAYEKGDQLQLMLCFNHQYLDEEIGTQWLTLFTDWLEWGSKQPDIPLSSLPLLSDRGMRKPCHSGKKLDFPRDVSLYDLFVQCTENYALRPAVVDENGEEISYQQLCHRVHESAVWLRQQGVQPGEHIALMLPRSASLVVTILAILACGACFIPLFPEIPERRLASIIKQANVRRVIISPEQTLLTLPDSCHWLRLNTQEVMPASQFTAPLHHQIDNIAYIIFTSGSTGEPKGVAVSHRAFVNHVIGSRQIYQLSPEDRVVLKTTLSFDVGVHELLVTLTSGACLVIAPPEASRDPYLLSHILKQQSVTLLHAVPSLIALLMDEESFSQCEDLRMVISAGEALPVSLYQRFTRHYRAQLYNCYGPTETTVYVSHCCLNVPWQNTFIGEGVPIGHAMPNVDFYVLDRFQRAVPDGWIGELCIGGEALAQGYINQPELTSQRFPLLTDTDGKTLRLYQTGDYVRWTKDQLFYLGRIDNQLKINGYRVETGEVENALLRLPFIALACVSALTHPQGHKVLVAHYCLQSTQTPLPPSEIKQQLRIGLPEYMIPTHFITLDKMPLLSNGKVDKKALASSDCFLEGCVSDSQPSDSLASGSKMITLLETLWQTLLNVKKVNHDADFFTLGGDSILAMQLSRQLRQHGYVIAVKDLYIHSTFNNMLALMSPTTTKVTEAHHNITALLPSQRWFLSTIRTDTHHWNQALLLESDDALNTELLRLSMQALVLSHRALVTPVRSEKWDTSVQVDANFEKINIEPHDIELQDFAATLTSLLDNYQRSLNPEQGPLFRMVHITSPSKPDLLFMVAHHLVIDGVSWRILVDDVWRYYQTLQQGKLPEITLESCSPWQWFDVVQHALPEWQQQHSLWKQQWLPRLAGSSYGDAARPVIGPRQKLVMTFSSETSQLLFNGSLNSLGTVEEILVAAYSLALMRWQASDWVSLDIEGHGRSHSDVNVDISGTIGWFTAIYPFTARLPEQSAELIDTLRTLITSFRPLSEQSLTCLALSGTTLERVNTPYCFNYLGRFDQLLPANSGWHIADFNYGDVRSRGGEIPYRLENNLAYHEGKIIAVFEYLSSEQGYADTQIEYLAQIYQQVINQTVQSVLSPLENQKALTYRPTQQQQGMLIEALAAEQDAYVEQFSCYWQGPLDHLRLSKAWQQLLQRHDGLRTGFDWQSQDTIVATTTDVNRPEDALYWINQDEISWEALCEREKLRGFTLDVPPLLRLCLYQDESGYRLLLTYHHLIMDGWSLALIMEQFYSLYLNVSLKSPAPQFSAYTAWLADYDDQASKTFWQEKLRYLHEPSPLGVVTESPVNSEMEEAYRSYHLSLPLPASSLLTELQHHKIGINHLLQALFALQLWRFSGQTYAEHGFGVASFGVTYSGRALDFSGIESCAGLFVNCLPIVVSLTYQQSLLSVAIALRTFQLEANEHAHLSMSELMQMKTPSFAGNLFNAAWVYENYPQKFDDISHRLEAEGIRISQVHNEGGKTRYPLTLLVYHASGEINIRLIAQSAALGSETMECMMQHWRQMWSMLGDGGLNRSCQAWLDTVSSLPLPKWHKKSTDDDHYLHQPLYQQENFPYLPELANIWQSLLGIEKPTGDLNFFQAGGHSLLAAQLISHIRQHLQPACTLAGLLKHPTFAAQCRYLTSIDAGEIEDKEEQQCLIVLKEGTGNTLFLFHPPGGHVICYQTLVSFYHGNDRIIGVQDPRLFQAQDKLAGVKQLAQFYADEIQRHYPQGTISLGGISGGGIIAQACARYLQQLGRHVSHVLLLDCAVPNGELTDTLAENSFLNAVIGAMQNTEQNPDNRHNEYITQLSQISSWIRHDNGSDPFELFRRSLTEIEQYQPEPYSGRVMLFRALQQDLGEAEDNERYYREPGMGWERLCPDLCVTFAGGNHVSLIQGEQARWLIQKMQRLSLVQ